MKKTHTTFALLVGLSSTALIAGDMSKDHTRESTTVAGRNNVAVGYEHDSTSDKADSSKDAHSSMHGNTVAGRNNVAEGYDSTQASSDENMRRAVEWESNKRLTSWQNSVKDMTARLDRATADDDVEAGTEAVRNMERDLKSWEKHHMELTDGSKDSVAESTKQIATLDRNMEKNTQEFRKAVSKDSVDYKNELQAVIKDVEQAERDIESRLNFLDNRQEAMKELKSELTSVKNEAEDHLASLEDSTEDSWKQVKTEIDSWMNETFEETS